jgi:hypothetical protein
MSFTKDVPFGIFQGASIGPSNQAAEKNGGDTGMTPDQTARYRKAMDTGKITQPRAEEYARLGQEEQPVPKNFTNEEIKGIYQHILQQANDFKNGKTDWVFPLDGGGHLSKEMLDYERQNIDPQKYAHNYTDAYVWARGKGWSEKEAQDYAAGGTALRPLMKVGKVAENIWGSAVRGMNSIASKLGVDPYLLSSDESSPGLVSLFARGAGIAGGDLGLIAAAHKSWADKVAEKSPWKGVVAKVLAGVTNGAMNVGDTFTNPTNLALIAASRGASLPEQLGMEAPVAVSRIVRTVSQTANMWFTSQMTIGGVEGAKETIESAKKGDISETIENAVNGLAQGLVALHGMSSEIATSEVHQHLDDASLESFGKPFDSLDTPKQAIVLDKAYNEDPYFREVEKNADAITDRNIKKIAWRRSAAIQQAWSPNAVERGIKKIYVEAQANAAVDNTIRELTERIKSAKEINEARAKAASDREEHEARSSEIPETKEKVESKVDDYGNKYYPAKWHGEDANFRVTGVDGDYRVYVEGDEGGTRFYLGKNGIFGSEEENSAIVKDEETAHTLAQIHVLKAKADLEAENGIEGSDARREKLFNISEKLRNGEIDTVQAQEEAGLDVNPYQENVHAEATKWRVEGPYIDGGLDKIRSLIEEMVVPDEETRKFLIEKAPDLARRATIDNLNLVQRSGDGIEVNGERWELGEDGLLHGPEGRTVPLMRDGLYSNEAMNMAAHGRVGYGAETRRGRIEREKQEKIADEVIQQALIPGEEKLRAKEAYGWKHEVGGGVGRPPVMEEGDQGASKETEGSFANLLMSIDDAKWEDNPGAAERIVRREAERLGIPYEVLMRRALGLKNSPAGIVARLNPGDTIEEYFPRIWTVVEGKNGRMRLESTGAIHEYDPLKPPEWLLKKVDEAKEVVQKKPFTEEEFREVAYNRPYFVKDRENAVEAVKRGDNVSQPMSEEEAKASASHAAQVTVEVTSKAVADQEEALNPGPGATEEQINKNVKKAEESIKIAEKAAVQEAEAKSKTVPKKTIQKREPVPGLIGDPGEIIYGEMRIPYHYKMVMYKAVIPFAKWEGKKWVPNDEFKTVGLQPRTIEDDDSEQVAFEAELKRFNIGLYVEKSSSSLLGTTIIDPGGEIAGGNRRYLRFLKYLENVNKLGTDEAAARKDTIIKTFNDFGNSVGIKDIPDDGVIRIPVRVLDNPIETTQDAVKYGEIFNKPISRQISTRAHGVSLSKLLSDEQLEQIGMFVDAAGEGGLREAVRMNRDYFVNLATNTLLVSPEEGDSWFDKDSYGNRVLSNRGIDQLQEIMFGKVVRDPSVFVGLMDDVSRKPIVAFRSAASAVSMIAKMQALPDSDISSKIEEALVSSALTHRADIETTTTRDRWDAVYAPDQTNLAFNQFNVPQMPDRVVEALWRALNVPSKAESPRSLSDPLKKYLEGRYTMTGAFPGFTGAETPVEAFNRAFEKQLKAVQHSRNMRGEKYGDWKISPEEWSAAMNNRGHVEQEPKEEKAKEKAPEPTKAVEKEEAPVNKGSTPPPPDVYPKVFTAKNMHDFIMDQPVLRPYARAIMDILRIYVRPFWERERPEGFDSDHVLDWALQKAGTKLMERDKYDENHKGYYDLANHALKLCKAADVSTFIHECVHMFSVLLDESDWKAIDTIKIDKRAWEKEMGRRWTYTGEEERQEKLAYGLEKVIRDEKMTDFEPSVNAKGVLLKLKEIFREIYIALTYDPLAAIMLSEKAKEWFFYHLGVEGIGEITRGDEFKKEMKRAKEKTKNEEPIVTFARKMGAIHIQNLYSGKIIDTGGLNVSDKNPIIYFVFGNKADAKLAEDAILSGKEEVKAEGTKLFQGEDGTWAVKINTPNKTPRQIFYQELPPANRGEMGVERERLMKELEKLPRKSFARTLVEYRISELSNKIRESFGVEGEHLEDKEKVINSAIEEKKNESARLRAGTSGWLGVQGRKGTRGIPKPTELGVPNNEAARAGRGAGPRRLRDVKDVSLLPLKETNLPPVGTTDNDVYDPKKWQEEKKEGGLSESGPPPTWPLDVNTVAQLEKHPGEKQTAQIVLSALQNGDGVVAANATGTGKGFIAMAAIKEWGKGSPDEEKPPVLYITKNDPLLKEAQRIASDHFGFHLSLEKPNENTKYGRFAVSYQTALRDPVYRKIKWSLVVADESGEARNWFVEPKRKPGSSGPVMNQGKVLMEIMRNSDKGIYMSATPFSTPMEYGYLEKLNLWPQGKFEDWIKQNFETRIENGKVVALMDPSRQAKLRQQLIERGQMVSQSISYDGLHVHFGIVPTTLRTMDGLERIRFGFQRARDELIRRGKNALTNKVAAYEATYTKAFLERDRLPQAIELARKGTEQGYQVIIASPTTQQDLFHREPDGEPSAYQKMDEEMGGKLSKILPNVPNVFEALKGEFGDKIGNYSGTGQSITGREKVREDFLKGDLPMVYMSIPAGGIGGNWQDADFRHLEVKGGDKPRLMIVLGPPYSGVMLEQLLGRPWRNGVKSDTHIIFLASDSEPDIRLMNEKVAPRLRSLRAAVHGQDDSVATAFAHYSRVDQDKVRQDFLAYAEGNEVKITAADMAVRNKGRHVGISDWSSIVLPPAEEAKNKGMKYGKELGGDSWSTLFQGKSTVGPPPTKERNIANEEINAIGNGAMTGTLPSLQNLEPSEREAVVGGAAAMASDAINLPIDRNQEAVARQAMEFALHIPKGMVLTYEWKRTRLGFKKLKAVWKFPDDLTGTYRPKSPSLILAAHEIGAKGVRPQYSGELVPEENIGNPIDPHISSVYFTFKTKEDAVNAASKMTDPAGFMKADGARVYRGNDGTWAVHVNSYYGAVWDEERKTHYFGIGSMVGGIKAMARQAGVPEVGLRIERMIKEAQLDQDTFKAQYRYYSFHAFKDNGLKMDGKTIAEVVDVVEGKMDSSNPAINKAAETIREMNEWAAYEVESAGVERITSSGNREPWSPRENYFPHMIDWNAEIEYSDPVTGMMVREKLKDAMKRTFGDEKRGALVASLAARSRNADGNPVSPDAMDRWLRQHYDRRTPVMSNIQRERTIDFPVIRHDKGVFDEYADQLGKAIAIAKNYGPRREKIEELVSKIPSVAAQRDIRVMLDSLLSPKQFSEGWYKFTSAMTAFTALTKMPLSFAKVGFHSTHAIYALHGDVRPMVKAFAKIMAHPGDAYENAVFIGTLARQTDFTGVIEGYQSIGWHHWMFDVNGFNQIYNWGRIYVSEAARIEMEQYSINRLLKGGRAAEEERRILTQTMLLDDGAIDRAIANRRFSQEDINKAQVAFANEVMFTDNPLEMPGWARPAITEQESRFGANFKRALSLSYSMAAFTVKTRMFLRKHIWDEVFLYHNPKMIAAFMAFEPVIGTAVMTAGNAATTGIQRTAESLTGNPRTESALDKEKELFEKAWSGGWGEIGSAEKAKLVIDIVSVGIAQELVKLFGSMITDIAADPKKAISEAEYIGPDMFEEAIGPIWRTVLSNPLLYGTDEAKIFARGGPQEHERALHRTWKELFGEMPVLRTVPAVKKLTAPPPRIKHSIRPHRKYQRKYGQQAKVEYPYTAVNSQGHRIGSHDGQEWFDHETGAPV